MLATTLETSQQQRPIDAGVLRPLVQSYVDHLAARGYRPATIHSLESRARHFCSWLVHSDIAASSINNDMIEQFARHTCQCSGTSVTFSPNTAYIGMVRKFLAFLIESGTIQQPRCEAVAPSDDRLGHASIQSTEIYLRTDPTEKLDALAMGVPPTLKRGKFQVPDKLMAMFREVGRPV